MIETSTGRVRKRQWRYCPPCQATFVKGRCPTCAGKGVNRSAYVYSIVVDGKRRRKQYDTRAEAQTALDALKEELKQPRPVAHPDADLALSAYADRWIERAEVSLEPKTVRGYRDMLRLHIRPTLGDVKVGELQRSQVKVLLTDKRSGGLSKDTVRLIRATLSVMLADAVDDGIIPRNPANGLRGRKGLDKASATERQQRIRPMRRESLTAFLDAARNAREEDGRMENRSPETVEIDKRRDQRDYTLFLTMADAGLRPGEALALRWEDVELADRTLTIERAVSMGRVKSTKTGRTRTVDLTRRLADALSRWQAKCEADALAEDREPFPWVFPSDAGAPLDYAGVARRFRSLLRRAALPRHSPYDLRHTFATDLLAGTETVPAAPITCVAAQMGHANPSTTLRHYAHWIPRGDKRLIDRLEQARIAAGTGRAQETEAPLRVSAKSA